MHEEDQYYDFGCGFFVAGDQPPVHPDPVIATTKATQYLEEADRLADQIVIIDSGQVVSQGTLEALKDSLGTRIDVVAERSENIDAAAAVMASWVASPPDVDGDERRVSTQIVASTLTLPEVVRTLEIANIHA